MNRLLLFFLGLSIFTNIFLFSKINWIPLDRQPPWSPFELNSNLTLESLVEEGYQFGAMPCDQVQYYKTMADTTIQYEVDLGCHTYEKRFGWYHDLKKMSIIHLIRSG